MPPQPQWHQMLPAIGDVGQCAMAIGFMGRNNNRSERIGPQCGGGALWGPLLTSEQHQFLQECPYVFRSLSWITDCTGPPQLEAVLQHYTVHCTCYQNFVCHSTVSLPFILCHGWSESTLASILCRYVTYMYISQQGLKHKTIKASLSGLRFMHIKVTGM